MGALIPNGHGGCLEKGGILPRTKRVHVSPLAKTLAYPIF
jgi:hypothetical protein